MKQAFSLQPLYQRVPGALPQATVMGGPWPALTQGEGLFYPALFMSSEGQTPGLSYSPVRKANDLGLPVHRLGRTTIWAYLFTCSEG